MSKARLIFSVVGALAGACAFGATVGCTVSSEPPNLAGQEVRLTILHTADIHSRVFPYKFAPGAIDKGLGLLPKNGGDTAIVGGIARIATVIARERAASQRVLHLDSGDIFEGAPVFNTFAGEVEMRAMTRLGLNAMALGNHEFDKGAVNLELMKENFGGFPILAANYIFADPDDPTQPKLRKIIAPFTIFNVQGLRVGVIGMGNLSSLQGIFDGGNSLGITPLETTMAVRDTVNLIRGSVDVVIMISHLGLDVDESVAQAGEGVDDQNPNIDGIDVTLGGHLHIVLNPPKDLPRHDDPSDPTKVTGHTILCHSGAFAKYVGRLDLAVHVADPKVTGDRNGVKSYTYKLIPIDDSIPEDADMANMLEPYQLKLNTDLNLTHNYAVIPCLASSSTCPKVLRNDPDGGDSQLGNLVAASMRLRPRVEADFGLTNSLGIRADFESGPLNLEEMYNVFPFDNTITTMFLSGNEISSMLDFVASVSATRGCKTQAQVSGIWFIEDCGTSFACGPFRSDGTIATGCNHDGTDGPFLLGDNCRNSPKNCQPVLPAGEYRVAVNDYIASGGSGFAVLKRNTTKFNTGISLRDALVDYIVEQSSCSNPSQFSNLAQVMCQSNLSDPNTIADCTAMCCSDQADMQSGCSTSSTAFKTCQSMALNPTIAFDNTSLPCLDPTATLDTLPQVQPHDGRITMVGGGG